MPRLSIDPPSSKSLQLRPPPVGRPAHQPPRLRDWAGLTDADVLARSRANLGFSVIRSPVAGVVVDRQLQSSHANIYALGDCAEVDGLNLLYVMPLMGSVPVTDAIAALARNKAELRHRVASELTLK